MKGNNNNSGNEQEARVFWLSICTHTTTSNTDECVEVATKTTDANVANLWAWQICYLIWIAAGLRQFTAYLLQSKRWTFLLSYELKSNYFQITFSDVHFFSVTLNKWNSSVTYCQYLVWHEQTTAMSVHQCVSDDSSSAKWEKKKKRLYKIIRKIGHKCQTQPLNYCVRFVCVFPFLISHSF